MRRICLRNSCASRAGKKVLHSSIQSDFGVPCTEMHGKIAEYAAADVFTSMHPATRWRDAIAEGERMKLGRSDYELRSKTALLYAHI